MPASSVTGTGVGSSIRPPIVIYGVGKVEDICSACNGTGEPKVKAFRVCGKCRGTGCELNETGKGICQLVLTYLKTSDNSLTMK